MIKCLTGYKLTWRYAVKPKLYYLNFNRKRLNLPLRRDSPTIPIWVKRELLLWNCLHSTSICHFNYWRCVNNNWDRGAETGRLLLTDCESDVKSRAQAFSPPFSFVKHYRSLRCAELGVISFSLQNESVTAPQTRSLAYKLQIRVTTNGKESVYHCSCSTGPWEVEEQCFWRLLAHVRKDR